MNVMNTNKIIFGSEIQFTKDAEFMKLNEKVYSLGSHNLLVALEKTNKHS